MGKITAVIVGAAGEYYVLSQLLRRGWIAAMAPDGVPNMDILVTDEKNNKLCAIQVKTRRDIGKSKVKGWHMSPKHEKIIAEDLFYAFVDVGKQPSDRTTTYILPSKVVADHLRETHQVWLSTPGKGGVRHKETKFRMLVPDASSQIKFVAGPATREEQAIIDRYKAGWLDQYKENWSTLGLPEADSF